MNTRQAADAIVEHFNRQWPVDSEVLFINDLGQVDSTIITLPAHIIGNGEPNGGYDVVTHVSAKSGCVGLWRVIPVNLQLDKSRRKRNETKTAKL